MLQMKYICTLDMNTRISGAKTKTKFIMVLNLNWRFDRLQKYTEFIASSFLILLIPYSMVRSLFANNKFANHEGLFVSLNPPPNFHLICPVSINELMECISISFSENISTIVTI